MATAVAVAAFGELFHCCHDTFLGESIDRGFSLKSLTKRFTMTIFVVVLDAVLDGDSCSSNC